MAQRKGSEEQKILMQFQGDLPGEKRPFRAIAPQAGTTEERVLDTLRNLIRQGRIRKFGALLRHQEAGITRNAMWSGPCRRTGRKRPAAFSHPSVRSILAAILERKYGFDDFNDWFFAGGARAVGGFLSNVGDRAIIDGFIVNGAARVVGWVSALVRPLQSGYVYHYAFTMIIGLFALLTWLLSGAMR